MQTGFPHAAQQGWVAARAFQQLLGKAPSSDREVPPEGRCWHSRELRLGLTPVFCALGEGNVRKSQSLAYTPELKVSGSF